MWQRRVDVNLAILAPLILGGVGSLAVFAADWGLRALGRPLAEGDRTTAVAMICGVAVYVVASAFAWAFLRPMRRLLATAASALAPRSQPQGATRGEFDRLGEMVDQVAEVLGALEAKALFPEMVGESRAMRGVFSQILKVAATEATVLLTGESGSGKELAARGIHAKSGRAKGPFVTVNCAAIPSGLLESELFGHEKGAFTGAVARKIGKFEQAQGGTLFLDEIGDMPPETQAKILRVLETRECERVGGTRPVALDVRIIAATNRNLMARMGQGLFREDLYHRLNVFPIRLPPLRERREDIALLAERFLEAAGRLREVSLPALQRLLAHDWPGNVRELRNVMERAGVLAGDGPIGPEHLPGLGAEPIRTEAVGAAGDLDSRVAAYEKALIEAALSRTGGIQARAATLLGIKERSLWHRVKKLGIEAAAFRISPES